MDMSQFFRNLSTTVLSSVVAVEDKKSEQFWVGSIIHKSAAGIFILTQAKLIKPKYQLYVHFHDNIVAPAELLVRDSPFAVVYLKHQHDSSTTIRFSDHTFSYSEALCVIPKSENIFQSMPGFIPVPSCAANDCKGANQSSGYYFLFMCHHEDTETMTPAPVFHKRGDVNGFVMRDCVAHKDRYKVDVHMKICLKSARVVVWLKKIVNNEDWKRGLELKLESKELKSKELKSKERKSKAAGKRQKR